MKKLLALVLALVMSMSLVTISNAAFSDADKIDHKEAVDVMSALGVINGMPDGSFAPAGNVTRAEMAKMITLIMLGNVDASAFVGTSTDLTDINGHWAEGFVKYCYSQGIISGKGNGIFDPNANVTTVEASKMLLGAIGYNSAVQGYTGADWAINVTRDAQISGFYDQLKGLSSAKALTRDEAAQMIYNAVQAPTVVKTSTIDSAGKVSYHYSDKNSAGMPNASLLNKSFDAYNYTGVLATPSYSSSNKEYTYTAAAASSSVFKDINGVRHTEANFKTTKDFSELEGQEVMVTIVVAKNNDVVVLNMASTGKTTVVTAPVSALEADGSKLKVNGVKYEIESPVTLSLVDHYSYDLIKLTDANNNGKLDTVVRTSVTPAKVSYVSDKEVIAGGTSYKTADNNVPAGLAKDNYVTATKKVDDSYDLVKLDKFSGKVEGYKTDKVLLGGTWYYYAGSEFVNTDAGKDVTCYIVNGVVVTGTKEILNSTTLDGIVLVADVDINTTVIKYAKVVKQDGTKQTLKIDEISNGYYMPNAGDLCTYTETSNGYKFKLVNEDRGDYKYDATSLATAGSATAINTIKTIGIADSAVVFMWNGTNDGKVITGKQLKSLSATTYTSATDMFTGKADGLNRVVLAAFNNTTLPTVGGEVKTYALVVSDSYKVDDDYITFQIWDGSSVVTVKEKDASKSYTKKTVIGYSELKDGIIKDTASTGTAAFVNGLTGDNVWLNGESDSSNKYKLDKNTVYMYYDASATETNEIGMAGGELRLADKVGNTYIENVKFVDADSDKTVDFILIDVKNNIGTTYTIPSTVNATNAPAGVTGAKKDAATSAKAGDTITYTLTNTNGTACDVRVRLTDASAGTQDVFVTVPAKVGTVNGTIDVSFRQPSDDSSTVAIAAKVAAAGIGATTFNGTASAKIDVASVAYKDDTVTFTLTISGTSNATTAKAFTVTGATLTNGDATAVGTPAGITSVAVSAGNTVTITPTAAAVAGVYTFTGTVTGAISIT